MKTTYVFRSGQFVDKKTGKPMEKPFDGEIVAPLVMPDTPEHIAPDGTLVTSRSIRDEVCKRNDWVPYERLNTKRPRGYSNKRYAEKRGGKWSEEAAEYISNRRKETQSKIAPTKAEQLAAAAGRAV